MIKRIMLAIAIGIVATAALIVLSFAADSHGFTSLAHALSSRCSFREWVGAHRFIRCTRVHRSTFLHSLLASPLASFFTACVAYAALSVRRITPNRSVRDFQSSLRRMSLLP